MPLLALPFPAIDPVLISIGPIAIRWYALAYIVGLLAGWWLCRRLVANTALWTKPPGTPVLIDDLLVWVAFGVIIGGRLAYVLFYDDGSFLADPIRIIAFWDGGLRGMSFHGGLIGAAAAIALFARRHGLPVLSMFDLCAVVAPIGLFLGRIANFINGELYGRVTDLPWAVVFPTAGPEPRHPSQLYEAFGEGLMLFAIMLVMVRAGALKRPGLTAGVFGAGYALVRILVEFVREPDAQLGFLIGGLTRGMALSLPLLAAGLVLTWQALRPRRA